MNKLKFSKLIIVAGVGLLILPALAMADWFEPTDTPPPQYIVPVPINVSANTQDKTGSLKILGDFTAAGSYADFIGPVGIGSYFKTSLPRSDLALDVDGAIRADSFCLRNLQGVQTGVCLSLNGQSAIGISIKGPAGDTGPAGAPGPVGLPGKNVSYPLPPAHIRALYPGPGVLFKDSGGAKVSVIGAAGLGGVSSGTIGRDYTVDPCPSGSYVSSASGADGHTPTCVSPVSSQITGLTALLNADPAAPSLIIGSSQTGSGYTDTVIVDGNKIQGTVKKSCTAAGKAIGKIAASNSQTFTFQDVDVGCADIGFATNNYCYFTGSNGRTFTCVNNGVTTSIDIP